MKCPICGATLPPTADRCPDCGYHCAKARASQTQAPAAPTAYDPPNKSPRRPWCCCAAAVIIPLLVLLTGMIFGITAFVLSEVSPEDFGFEFFSEAPVAQPEPEPPLEEAEGDCFSIRDGEITFLPQNWDGSPVLKVPSVVDGQTVTAIAPGCFRDCTDLTTIVLPDTVTRIGPEAFAGCTALRGLPLPVGTETIGSDAFAGCISLESVYVPGSVTSIAGGCFDDCASLLYIFYEGSFEDWNALYSDFVNPFTTAICSDGAYYHGAVK